MKLRFYARKGHCVHWTGRKSVGQMHAHAGRRLVLNPDKDGGVLGAEPASEEPIEVDEGSEDANHFSRSARKSDPGLWPADKATAEALGVPFVELEFNKDEGEWLPKKASKSKSSASSPSSFTE